METGPILPSTLSDLEALKWRLAAMDTADELPTAQAEAMRQEISAIRLHLKRLDLERKRVAADLDVRLGLRLPPEQRPETGIPEPEDRS